jgi:hypothetical protein
MNILEKKYRLKILLVNELLKLLGQKYYLQANEDAMRNDLEKALKQEMISVVFDEDEIREYTEDEMNSQSGTAWGYFNMPTKWIEEMIVKIKSTKVNNDLLC